MGVVAFNNVESAVLAKSKKVTFVEQLAREQSEYFVKKILSPLATYALPQ